MENIIEWRELELFNNYEISKCGLIRNKSSKKILKQNTKNGYNTVNLSNKTVSIHRLVAFTFLEKIGGKDYVNHIDGNKLNNNYSNLEWVSQKENVQHSVEMNLIKPFTRKVVQLSVDDDFIKEFSSVTLAADTMNCSRRAIDLVCKGTNPTAKGFKWKYLDKPNSDQPENCKIITEYPQYKVSSLGEIYSIRSKKVLKAQKNSNGYLWVQFSVNNKKKNVYIHQLVAQHFIENADGKTIVNHIDGDKTNNNVENLEWVTQSENMKHYNNIIRKNNL